MIDSFASSDASRSAAPLRYARIERFNETMKLQRGGSLPGVEVTYETYGTLNAERSNAVLVCHALSGDSHVAAHDTDDTPGWWDIVVGPGKAIDTDRWFVICPNILGGCRGTTGPCSINPETGQPFGPGFPEITVEDMVDVQRMLVDRLGIRKLFAVVGGSLGGMQVLTWATRYPDRVAAAVAIATAPHLSAQALAFDIIGRNAITRDPHYHDGHYYHQPEQPDTGLALARMLAHITYLSPQAMTEKFDRDRLEPRDIATAFEKQFSVGSYLAYQGEKFVDRFDANSYLVLSMAMDRYDLGKTREELEPVLAQSDCRWLVLSFNSDWLFPPRQSRLIADSLIASRRYVSYCDVVSDAGHDAFLLGDSLDRYGEMVRAFLEKTTLDRTYAPPVPDADNGYNAPVVVINQNRLDYDRIIELVEPGSDCVDLGCGRGGLLARLAHRRDAQRLVGIELDEHEILATMRRGFDVIQADLNEGLPDFGDGEFDYAILSQTLQTIVRTEAIVDEVLRVGRRGIVSFPNFAYKTIRDALGRGGRSPGTEHGLLHFDWFNTPNRRFLSVLDWQEFCDTRAITIERAVYLNTESGQEIAETDEPNLNADLAIFVIRR